MSTPETTEQPATGLAAKAEPARKPKKPKFDVLGQLQQEADKPRQEDLGDEVDAPARITNTIDAALHRRLLLYVADQKSKKRYGQRVSIRKVLEAALTEYLDKRA